MTKAKFSVGTVVQLKSGGIAMTVEVASSGKVGCIWSDKTGRLRRETLPAETLQLFDQYRDVPMLVIEGLTHSSDEVAEILKGQGNA